MIRAKNQHPLLIALLALALQIHADSGAVLEVAVRPVFHGDALLPDS